MLPNHQVSAASIFKPSGYPENSLIIRYPFFPKLLSLIQDTKSRIIEISGASRTGKSVMVDYCFNDQALNHIRKIHISGDLIKSVDDFKKILLAKLYMDNTMQHQFTFGANIGVFSAEIQSQINELPIDIKIIQKIKEQSTAIIIDDFHWLPENTRIPMIRTLKSLMEEADREQSPLRIILIMIPTKSIHDSNIWEEVSAERVKVFRIPLWQVDELRQIAAIKFAQIGNVTIGLRNLAEQCYGLPSIMQSLCLEYCNIYHNGLVPNGLLIDLEENRLPSIFRTVALDTWHTNIERIYDKITSGSAVKDNALYQRRDGKWGNINQIILNSLVNRLIPAQESNNPSLRTIVEYTFENIMDRIERTVAPAEINNITKEIIIENLNYISTYLEKTYNESLIKSANDVASSVADPILEFDSNRINPVLRVYSPSFLMSIRHSPGVDERWQKNPI